MSKTKKPKKKYNPQKSQALRSMAPPSLLDLKRRFAPMEDLYDDLKSDAVLMRGNKLVIRAWENSETAAIPFMDSFIECMERIAVAANAMIDLSVLRQIGEKLDNEEDIPEEMVQHFRQALDGVYTVCRRVSQAKIESCMMAQQIMVEFQEQKLG